MRELALLVPGRIDARTGGYGYDRRMAAGLRARGWRVDVLSLDPGFPRPAPQALDHAARVLAGIPDGALALVDGLALGAMPVEVEREAERLKIVALVHLPLAAHVGLDRETARMLEQSERRALAAASLVVVTGRPTVAALADYGIAPDRIALVEPGTDRAPLARGSVGAPLHLLAVAAITPGKGHDILVEALAAVPHREWLLTCAGSLERDPASVARLRASIRARDLERCVSLAGELDAPSLEVCYSSADVFVLPTLHETFCMAVAEALAHGLPVVSTTTGAIPDLVGRGGEDPEAGLLVTPGDVQALTTVLTDVLCDARVRARLREGARRVRDRLPTWDDAVDLMIAALGRIATANDVA